MKKPKLLVPSPMTDTSSEPIFRVSMGELLARSVPAASGRRCYLPRSIVLDWRAQGTRDNSPGSDGTSRASTARSTSVSPSAPCTVKRTKVGACWRIMMPKPSAARFSITTGNSSSHAAREGPKKSRSSVPRFTIDFAIRAAPPASAKSRSPIELPIIEATRSCCGVSTPNRVGDVRGSRPPRPLGRKPEGRALIP